MGYPQCSSIRGSAKLIGDRVGKVHEDSITRKTVVGHRYLRFKLDIEVRRSISVG